MRTREPALSHLAHVAQQVPAIRHLDRVRGRLRSGTRVLGRAVAGDHLDGRVAAEPGAEGRRGAVGQEIDDLAGLQIDENRTVGGSASKRPIIYAQNLGGRTSRQRCAPNQPEEACRG